MLDKNSRSTHGADKIRFLSVRLLCVLVTYYCHALKFITEYLN
jgi:hypothetical protein